MKIAVLLLFAFVVGGCAALNVVSYNVHHGADASDVYDLEKQAALLVQLGADLVGLQEIDNGTTRTKHVDEASAFAKSTGLHVHFVKSIDFEGGAYGIAQLSRFEILERRELHYASHSGEKRSAAAVRVTPPELGGRQLWFLTSHLDLNADKRDAQVAELKKWATETLRAKTPDAHVVITGDFNAKPSEASIHAMVETFTDVWAAVGSGDGYTIPSSKPTSRIDYAFVLKDRAPYNLTAVSAAVPVSELSDHRPFSCKLVLA